MEDGIKEFGDSRSQTYILCNCMKDGAADSSNRKSDMKRSDGRAAKAVLDTITGAPAGSARLPAKSNDDDLHIQKHAPKTAQHPTQYILP